MLNWFRGSWPKYLSYPVPYSPLFEFIFLRSVPLSYLYNNVDSVGTSSRWRMISSPSSFLSLFLCTLYSLPCSSILHSLSLSLSLSPYPLSFPPCSSLSVSPLSHGESTSLANLSFFGRAAAAARCAFLSFSLSLSLSPSLSLPLVL